MAQPARFTFDLDLEPRSAAKRPAPAPVPSIPEDVVAQLIANAREEAYAEGLKAGEQNAASMAAQTIAAAAGTLATQSMESAKALDAALSVGRKLALHLLARFPLTELEALIAECLPSLNGVPHLVIRCHPDLADAIRDTATAQMSHSGFTGRLVVMGDPEIRLGDGRLEWVDGGLVRDIADTARQVDHQIATYLAARASSQSKENGQ